jgi:hypothetical protein
MLFISQTSTTVVQSLRGGVMMRNRKAHILHALATSSLLAAGIYLATVESVPAQQRSAQSAGLEADSQIRLLLNRLEGLLGQQQVNSAETVGALISAADLLPTASEAGQQVMREFPRHLRARAKELRNGGLLTQSIEYEAFAEVAALYTKSQERPDEPITDKKGIAAQAPNPEPIPKAQVPPHPDTTILPAAVERTLLERGEAMLQQKNVAAARMLFERAANAGVGTAALKLANTYDPSFIAEHNLIGIKGDPQKAEAWYGRASALGEKSAEGRLKSLGSGRRDLATQ